MKMRIKQLTKYQKKYLLILSIYGASPSGKAAGFDPVTRRFESFRPRAVPLEQKKLKEHPFLRIYQWWIQCHFLFPLGF